VTSFKNGNVVLNYTSEPHDFDRMRSQRLLMVIPQRHEEKESCQKGDDDDADGGARQEFEMKVLRTEKPGAGSPENPSGYLCG
jgi:hypothetical protein